MKGVIAVLLVTSVLAVGLVAAVVNRYGVDTSGVPLEVAKSGMALLVVTVAGGVITLALKARDDEAALALKRRDEANAQKTSRLLRHRELTTRLVLAVEEVRRLRRDSNAVLPNNRDSITSKTYRDLAQRISVQQLALDGVRLEAQVTWPSALAGLREMTQYLAEVVEEYESELPEALQHEAMVAPTQFLSFARDFNGSFKKEFVDRWEQLLGSWMAVVREDQ